MSLVRKFARPLLASSFIISGVGRLRDSDANEYLSSAISLASKAYPAAGVLSGHERLLGQALAGTQVLAGSLFALGKAPRLSSAVLLATGTVNAYLDYRATQPETKAEKNARYQGALTHASLLGAIAISAVDRDGAPSMAWRVSKLSERVAKKSAVLGEDLKAKAEDILAS